MAYMEKGGSLARHMAYMEKGGSLAHTHGVHGERRIPGPHTRRTRRKADPWPTHMAYTEKADPWPTHKAYMEKGGSLA